MVIKTEKLIDFFFILFVFSSIVLSTSLIGKIFQMLLVVVTIFILGIKKIKINKYIWLDFIFFFYTLFQYFSNIAVLKSNSLSISVTILYNALFSLAIINYLVLKNDYKRFSELYAKSTLFSLIVLVIFYFESFISGRFDTSSTIYFIGGHSSTSLAIISAIPCVFLNLFSDNQEKNDNFIVTLLLLIISIATGTRKTLIIFLFIFIIIIPFKNRKINIGALIKIFISLLILIPVSLFLCFKVPILYDTIGYRIEGYITAYNVSTEQIKDDSIRVRKRMLVQAYNLFKLRKMYGWGMDYFRASGQNNLGYYSHNNFFEILVGGGIVGFVIYYLKYFLLFFALTKIKNEHNLAFMCTLFFLEMILIEMWQVTYIYRFIIIYQGVLISLLYNSNYIKGESNNEIKKA